MNRLGFFAFLFLTGLCAEAQSLTNITISTDPAGARYTVDGQQFQVPSTFVWPVGSKHTLVFLLDPLQPGQAANLTQTGLLGDTIYTFSGWQDNASLLTPSTDPIQIITADPHITSIKATLTVNYRISLNYFNSQDPTQPATCGAPGAIPDGQFRPGLIYIGSTCYWSSASVFIQGGTTVTLNAFPYPGFVFLGWNFQNGFVSTDYLTTLKVTAPLVLTPMFTAAKRVQFVTTPPGLTVLVDRATISTRLNGNPYAPCIETQPVPPQLGFPPLCLGDFDFAPGSAHLINGSTQLDMSGVLYAYDSWTATSGQHGQGQSNYITDNASSLDVVTVKYVRGAQYSFLTNPTGLNLTVDGRPNNPSLNFVWGLGTTHTISAIANQTDKNGRQYTFKSWSNGGNPAQTIVVDQSAVDNGYRITANYSVLSRLIVNTNPTGLNIQVDGKSCFTPCTVDRANGTQVRVTAPTTISLGSAARMDYLSWSDGGASDHNYTINSDYTTIFASYRSSYQLSAASDPGNAAAFQFSPSSPDMFYPQDTPVSITVTPNAGFKFRRWGGDLAGTFPSGTLTMSGPHSIVALNDRVPFIAPAGVRNAAGDTPNSAVAPGSVITIFGQSLAPVQQVGPVNPLAQTIAGVTVTVSDRILPLLFVSPQQINAMIPSDLPPGDYTLQIHSQGQPDVSGTFSVARNAPGLFTTTANDQTYAMAFHADGSLVTGDSPAKAGETISLLGTGFGPYSGMIIDGFFPPAPPPALADSLTISAAGQTPDTVWAGAASGYAGVGLVKFRIPDSFPTGTTVPLSVSVNGATSNTVMLPLL